MKKFAIFILLLLPALLVPFFAQAKKKSAHEVDNLEKVLSKKEISISMAEVWCSKLKDCYQGKEMGPKECVRVLKKSFMDGFKKVPQGQKIEVKAKVLNQCVESIEQNSCDKLKTASTLSGCEFITYLNRNS